MLIDKNRMKVKIGWIKYYDPDDPDEIIEENFPIIIYDDLGIEVTVDIEMGNCGEYGERDASWPSFAANMANHLTWEFGYKVIDYGVYE